MMLDQWHEFFVMVGGGAAALAGLVFVAISVNVSAMVKDSTHRNRAIGTLSGFTAAFLVCTFGLFVGQGYMLFGLEWLVISIIAGYIYVHGYFLAREEGSSSTLSVLRTLAGTGCYLIQIVGSILLIAGNVVGLYVAATGLTLFFPLMISGAWLLIVGIHDSAQK
jgi:hypothetical protein